MLKETTIDLLCSGVLNHFCLRVYISTKFQLKKVTKLIKKLSPKLYSYNLYVGNDNIEMLRHGCIIPVKLKNMKAIIIFYGKNMYDYGGATEYEIYITGKDAHRARAMLLKYLYPVDTVTDNSVLVYEQVVVEGVSTASRMSVSSANVGSIATVAWKEPKQVPAKKIENVFMSPTDKKKLLNYLSKWVGASQLFNSLEVSHKTGVLLYGEPGTGKTSLAKSLGSYLHCPVYIVNLSNFNDKVIDSIKDISGEELAIILLEDIDYIFGRRQAELRSEEKASGQALLQLLDGAANVTNKIFIATTNYVKSLDDAIIRDGRFDIKLHLGKIVSWDDASQFCKNLGLKEEKDIEEVIARAGLPVTGATLQNTVVQYMFEMMSVSEERSEERNSLR